MSMVQLAEEPLIIEFIVRGTSSSERKVALVMEQDPNSIHILNLDNSDPKKQPPILKMHHFPIVSLTFNVHYNAMISVD